MELLESLTRRAEREFHATLTFREWVPFGVRETLYGTACRYARLRWGDPVAPQCASVDVLAESGFVELPAVEAETIRAMNLTLEGCDVKTVQSDAGRKSWYPQEALSAEAPFLGVATRDDLIDVVEHYLGAPPVIATMTVIDSDDRTGRQNANFFHVDYHGHRAVKFFVYLTDVGEDCGPHEYVLGSHTPAQLERLVAQFDGPKRYLETQFESRRRHQGSFLINNDLVERYLSERIRRVTGPAGTAFAENTFGLHRGAPVAPGGRRRIFKVLYTALPGSIAAGPRTERRSAFDECLTRSRRQRRSFERLCHRVVVLDEP